MDKLDKIDIITINIIDKGTWMIVWLQQLQSGDTASGKLYYDKDA